MQEEFDLEGYLSNGVETIVKGALKATLNNPRESIFLAQYAIASKGARALRKKAEGQGEHIPPFLIASITSSCNLHCKGCYARANSSCSDKEAAGQLTDSEWLSIFEQAKDMGIGFILLAGGEPLMRIDVITAAGKMKDILFPIFTNGTMIDDKYLVVFSKNRNLVPVISLEDNKITTDARRDSGVYEKLIEATKALAPGDEERQWLNQKLLQLRKHYEKMLFISFPGDEKSSGGCLAAGRGFFHINAQGSAEPCPFSPFSDTNLRAVSLREALNSPLFRKLREDNILMEDHAGGCVLFEKEDIVRGYM